MCLSTKTHCYYCSTHVCAECSTNPDEHEAGTRKCKDCKLMNEANNEEKQEKKVKPAPKEQRKKPEGGKCKGKGGCANCKDSCEQGNTSEDKWCVICVRKKYIGKHIEKRGCKLRKQCLTNGDQNQEPKTTEEQNKPQPVENKNHQVDKNNVLPTQNNKRKPDESPENKMQAKTAREGTDKDEGEKLRGNLMEAIHQEQK